MTRKTPERRLIGKPCLITAVNCAGKPNGKPVMKDDGYVTLAEANKWIRANLPVKRRIDFRRGMRPKLKDLHLDGKAIVCVLGHYIYLDHETYWSYFKNSSDDVVTVWELKEA